MYTSQPAPHPAVAPMLLTLSLAMTGCSSSATPVAQKSECPASAIATLQEIMLAEVDPSADALWEAVEYISTPEGTQDRHPRTEEEWQTLRRSAVVLAEATNLLATPHRRVSDTNGSPGAEELNMAEIQQRVDSGRESFDQLAAVLRSASLSALAAIKTRNPEALMDAGAAIDAACEGCHRAYWYPDER